MKTVYWSLSARLDIQGIYSYIELFNSTAAKRVADRLIAAGENLAEFPHRGQPSGKEHRKLLTIWPYVIHYRVDGDEVTILRVRHGARNPNE